MSTATQRLASALFCAVLALACSTPEEPLTHAVVPSCLKVEQPTEKVFRTAEEYRAFAAANKAPATDGDAPVDFSHFMLAARFDGTGSACVGFTVERVTVKDAGVLVRATRHTSPNPCIAVVAYPQLMVSIEQQNLPVTFTIANATDQVPGQTEACR